MGYVVYAINQNGEGFTQQIGTYEDLEDIAVHVNMFAPDVVIHIEAEQLAKRVTPAPSITPTTTLPGLVVKTA